MAKITEKQLDKIYDTYCEEVNWPASQKVMDAERTFINALDEYVAAVSENGFRDGFKYAIEKFGNKNR